MFNSMERKNWLIQIVKINFYKMRDILKLFTYFEIKNISTKLEKNKYLKIAQLELFTFYLKYIYINLHFYIK